MSQEILAEKVGISVTHMSHIETGNTKLSLAVLVEIAKQLEVKTDDILFCNKTSKSDSINELSDLLDTCSSNQLRILTDIIKATINSLNKHSNQSF